MARDQAFESQDNPIAGVDEAAKLFYDLEQKKHAIARGESPPEALGKAAESEESASKPASEEIGADPDSAAPEDAPEETIEAGAEEQGPGAGEQTPAEEPEGEEVEELSLDTAIGMADGSEVTLKELQLGYQRHADYTRKTTELAEHRKQFEANAGQLAVEVEKRIQHVGELASTLEAHLAQVMPNQQQLEQLRKVDPGEYAARVEDIRNKQGAIAQAKQAQQAARQEAERRVDEERAARVPAERAALAEVIPAFKKDFDTEYERLGRYALASDGGGLRPEEWDLVDDHRYVTLVWKAREYDKATRKTAPVVRKAMARKPKTVRSGSPREAGQAARDEVSATMAHLKANPDSKDAQVNAFLARERAKRAQHAAAMRRT
jgi:hypothetical protein